MTADHNVDIDSYYVFVARFDDGRMKDKVRFIQSESVTEAEESLDEDWVSRDDVYLDALGRFSKFYMLAPQLNYDFPSEVDVPKELLRAVGSSHVTRILHIASSDDGWDEMPPREAILSTDPSFSVISEEFSDTDPVTSDERSLLTDKLLVLRDRFRRIVKQDFVNYSQLDIHPPSKFGLLKNDSSALRILRRLEQTVDKVSSDEYAFVGVLLTRSGCPATSIDTWSEPDSESEGYIELVDYPEYDIVLRANPEWSRRKIQYRALNTICRWVQWSSESGFFHQWYSVPTPKNPSAERVVVYARNSDHASRKAKHLLPSPESVEDLQNYGVSRVSGDVSPDDTPGSVIIDREVSNSHVPDGFSECAADSMVAGKG